jgi:Ca2+/Na+ antiporter
MNKRFLEFIIYLIFMILGAVILVFSIIQNMESNWNIEKMVSGIFLGSTILFIVVYLIVAD